MQDDRADKSPAALFARLRGPLAPILPAFDDQQRLDVISTCRWVEHLIGQGVRLFWTTHGTSHYMSLTDEEVVELNRAVAGVTRGGRATFIASTPFQWPTQRCVEFTRAAADWGADAVKLQIDWKSWTPSDDLVVERYARVADESPLPLLAYTLLTPGVTAPLLRRIMAIPRFIGIKNDTGDFYEQAEYLRVIRDAGAAERFTSITGGTMASFLHGAQFGARAFATGTAVYAPDVAVAFDEHVKAGHFADAAEQVKQYEQPVVAAFAPLGHWACFHAALHLQGFFASPAMRFPLRTLMKDEVAQVRKVLESNGWLQRGK